ncbi:MAG: hypothetical protein AB8B51_18090 [Sedimentitalea sp.]
MPDVGHTIALALLENGDLQIGEQVRLWHMGELRPAQVIDPGCLPPREND